jgi:alkyl hydroperoxide reductase subunit D
MTFTELVDSIPDYAKDLKLNLGNVMEQTELTAEQAWGTAVACSLAARNRQLYGAVLAGAEGKLSPQALFGARAAAAVMGMNNIFYRFRHFSSNEKYGAMPARLRMQSIRTHGADPADFELWCLAVSAVNGCQVCVDSHENAVREKGLSEETVLAAIRIAAVIHALAAVVGADEAAVAPATAL